MTLHQDKTLFRQAVQFTADQLQISAIYIEKDYWVTYALNIIFKHEIGRDTIFKGGTALSKCFRIIDRFSEDIDLVVIRRDGESNSKLKDKIRIISEVVGRVLPEVETEGITRKMGMNRKTAHSFSKEFSGKYGQIRDRVILESSWLGHHEPFSVRRLNSYIGEMMLNNGQDELAEAHGLLPFEVNVLEPIRTICEKIMSLVRFSYGENPLDNLKKKIRHTYDLHQLLNQQEYMEFFNSSAFDEILLKVAKDDVSSFKNNNEWLIHHPNEALIFKDLDTIWPSLAAVYNGDFKNLVYGDLPKDMAVFETLKMIKVRLAAVNWEGTK
ncbi:Nucleotidyl transferase AbiEii toxin, Type IV TA system [Spirosomataceae bacterium TFI 002]|nr:Nucleotidyl transferase AbiEii toxin, Type IV TA system [Spirosomataceae bacterium TFI 002]